ncbi:MAG: DNRLRE domain-containing protein [Acidimicrobiales bacterium]
MTLSLLATPAIATPVVPEPVATIKARDLPALPSAPVVRAKPPIPAQTLDSLADVAPHPSELAALNRRSKPSAFDPARSTPVDADTTPTRRVYENPDGSHTAQLQTRPVRYQDTTGTWRDFDVTPVAAPDGSLAAKSAPRAAKLGSRADGAVATVDTSAGPIVLSHPGVTTATAALDGDKVTYRKAVTGGRDLVMQLTPDGFKETVILADVVASPTYVDRFSVPAGVTARQGDQGVEFVDAAGQVVATFGGGFAFDASFPAGGAGTSAPVAVRLLAGPSRADSSATVEVSVDAAWLATPGRAFPVEVDPTFYQNTLASQGGGHDTYVTSGPWANSSFGTSTATVSGADPNYDVSRALMYFDLGTLPGANKVVTAANMQTYNFYSPTCANRQTHLYGLGGPFSDTTTWNTQPPVDGSVVSGSDFAWGASGCLSNWAGFDITALARRWITDGAPNYGVQLRASNEADPEAIRYYYSGEAYGSLTAPAIAITYNTLPNIATPKAPAQTDPSKPAVVNTATPRLEVYPTTDPDGDAVQYFFRITESADAEIGSKTEGLPTSNPYFDVPAGSLQDGVTYYWHAWTKDPTDWRFPDWVWSFRVDLRLGVGAQATDQVGPASVNLANGNLNVNIASPSLGTVGGPVGLSYAYNSQAQDNAGLTGSYYKTRPRAGPSPARRR